MANCNEKTEFICGRNPLAVNDRPPFSKPEQTEAALWLVDGKEDAARSGAADFSGTVTDKGVLDFRLESDRDKLNAIVLSGGTTVLMHPEISLSGYGCSDFSCKGAGVVTMDGAKADIRGGKIVTRGVTRAATIATSGSTLKVFGATLESHGGPFPEGYVPVIGPGMMEPPAPLGLGGNCRTHLSMDNSESYFYDCDIYAAGWAALSTDSSGGYVYLEARDSRITMEGNGYIVYADNGCHVVLDRCQVSSGNVFGIQDGNSSLRLREVEGSCKGYGFLIHGGMTDLRDIGTIRLRDCDLTSAGPMFRCKSTNVDLYVRGGTLTGTEGVILESLLSDDKFYFKTRSHGDNEYGVQATFEEMELFGDFRCTDPERKHRLSFVHTALTGGISGYPEVRLTEGSSWIATKDSFVALPGCSDGIDAAAGVTIHAKGIAESRDLPSGGKLIAE